MLHPKLHEMYHSATSNAAYPCRNEKKLSINIKKKPLVAAVIALALMGAGLGATGAYFSASQPLTVNGSVASFGILINGAPSNAAPVSFSKFGPGVVSEGSFTVTDTSDTLAGVVYADQLINLGNVTGGGSLTAADLSKLEISIDGTNGYSLPFTPLSQLGTTPLSLGSIGVGATNTYYVKAKLSTAAGNEWIGASLSNAQIQITVQQAH